MKIGLEASRANKQFKTGTEWYAWHLLQNFKKIESSIGAQNEENKFIIYYNQDLAGDLSDAPANFYFKKLNWPFGKFWTHLRLGIELLIHPVDKFFATNSVPIFTRGELIATIHDLGFYKNPELYHPLERIYQKISHFLTVWKADKIVTISETTKLDIIKYFPDFKKEIKVIHLGYDRDTFKPIKSEDKKIFVDKHDYPDDFLLYIGRLESKKNVLNLIKAYKKSSRKWPLILAGRAGNFGYQEIEDLANDPDLREDVVLLGYVSQANYPRLMASASGFVFPSKFEGFGLPVLEAIASGVPVTCSDIPALREVAQDAALYFDPDNLEDIKDKIENIFDNQEQRTDLIEKGLRRAQDFSWERVARETLNFIKK